MGHLHHRNPKKINHRVNSMISFEVEPRMSIFRHGGDVLKNSRSSAPPPRKGGRENGNTRRRSGVNPVANGSASARRSRRRARGGRA